MPNEQEQRRAETHARGVGELALAKITAWPSTTAQVCSWRTGRHISGSVNMDKSLFCPTISDISAFLLYVKPPKSPAVLQQKSSSTNYSDKKINVTLDHKTSLKCKFVEIEIHTLSES